MMRMMSYLPLSARLHTVRPPAAPNPSPPVIPPLPSSLRLCLTGVCVQQRRQQQTEEDSLFTPRLPVLKGTVQVFYSGLQVKAEIFIKLFDPPRFGES